jgi:hypothetical protein
MNLRRVLTALAVLALFVGLASAQVVTPVPINCSVSAAVPNVRSQGVTEKPGDVILTCSGGPAPTASTTVGVDRATISIDFAGVGITSRTGSTINTTLDGNVDQLATDALLLIDEPGSCNGPAGAACTTVGGSAFPSVPSAGGYGQNADIKVCTALQQRDLPAPGLGGIQANCPAFPQLVGAYWVLDTTGAGGGHVANAYQGVTPKGGGNNTKLTFLNVPILSTGANNVARVYRLVNARLNVGSNASITASVTVTPNTGAVSTLNVTNNAVAAGTAASGLTTSMTTVGGATLCATTALQPVGAQSKSNMALLTFTEGFGTAFKTRVLPLVNSAYAAELSGLTNQVNATGNYPTQYNAAGSASATNITVTPAQSESGFVVQGLTVNGFAAGLADSGTRFKAVFKGLNSKATYYVSQVNVADYSTEMAVPGGAGGVGGIGDANPSPYAIAIANVSGNVIGAEIANPVPFAPVAAFGTLANTAGGVTGVHVIQLSPDSSGNAEVVWEVTNASTAVDTFNFAFYATYSNVTNAPPTGVDGTVTIGFAPTNGSSGQTTGSFIPRFIAPTAVANPNVFLVVPCQTTLLFPFVSNTRSTATTHWDTGIAIVNTGADPWNSVPIPSPASTTTTCNLTFYGPSAPPAMTTPPIAPGTSFAFTVSDPLLTGTTTVTNFAGYMFAVCNFQFAHAFVFVEDDTRSMAMGYLGLVVDNGSGIQRAATLTGERLSH